jgi:2-methylcitrate dehydratase PrpD
MSIQYNVGAALMAGSVSEKNFTLLNDARLHRLIGMMTLEVDEELTRAYPGKQGGEVEVLSSAGDVRKLRLEDVVNATPADVRQRFRLAVEQAVGKARAQEIEDCIETLDRAEDAGRLGALLRASAR